MIANVIFFLLIKKLIPIGLLLGALIVWGKVLSQFYHLKGIWGSKLPR